MTVLVKHLERRYLFFISINVTFHRYVTSGHKKMKSDFTTTFSSRAFPEVWIEHGEKE